MEHVLLRREIESEEKKVNKKEQEQNKQPKKRTYKEDRKKILN